MDLVFNELSIEPLCENVPQCHERISHFIEIVKKAIGLKFNKIRYDRYFNEVMLAENYSLEDFCNEPQNRTIGTLLRGLYRYPFIDEGSEEENRYIQSNFFLIKNDDTLKVYGLASAYLYSIPAIGFQSEDFWKYTCKFKLLIIGDQGNTDCSVLCVSDVQHYEHEYYEEWLNRVVIDLNSEELIKESFPTFMFDNTAIQDILYWRENKAVINKLISILNDIRVNPVIGGIGKTESLLGRTDTYSKRINKHHRIVYKIENDSKTVILSCRGHYD